MFCYNTRRLYVSIYRFSYGTFQSFLVSFCCIDLIANRVADGFGKNRICCIGILVKMGDKEEYDIGEACPQNCTNAYTTAMAIKRAKDRAIIKILGLYGKVYSDADVVTDKDGNKAFAEEMQVWEGSSDEQIAKAMAEVKNLKKATKVDLKSKVLTNGK